MIAFQHAIVQSNDAISNVVIRLIMADHENGLFSALQFREQLVIENLFEYRVLIRCPFVEDVERPVFEVSSQQGQTLTLP